MQDAWPAGMQTRICELVNLEFYREHAVKTKFLDPGWILILKLSVYNLGTAPNRNTEYRIHLAAGTPRWVQ